MTTTDHAALLDAAREAVALASGVCRQVQQSLEVVRSITKDDKSPVTVADFASQAIVARVLWERLGERRLTRLVAEEDSQSLREDERRPHLEAVVEAVNHAFDGISMDEVLEAIDLGDAEPHPDGFWTLDPIDGTKGFLRGQQYAVSLGWIEHGEPVVGALGCPNLGLDFGAPLDEADPDGSMYLAIRGQGLYELPGSGEGQATKITRLTHDDADAITVCASVEKAHSSVSDMDRILEYLKERGVEIRPPARLDSQAKYAVVGRGQADAYLRLPTRKGYVERIWDHAAGSLIAQEGGAAVSDIHGHALDFGQGKGLSKNAGVVCAPPRLHGMLLEAIRELGIGQDPDGSA